MITASQAREALVLLGWTPLTLAVRALLALDDIDIRHLGGLQLGAVRVALEAAGVDFLNCGEVGASLREVAL